MVRELRSERRIPTTAIRRLLFGVAITSFTLLPRCAGILGLEDGVLDLEDAGGPEVHDALQDTSKPIADAPADMVRDVVPDVSNPGDDTGAPTGCAARKADESHGVFVDPAGADVFDCGVLAGPCQTIAKGVERAKTLSLPKVFVAPAVYFGPVALVGGVDVEGGWTVEGKIWTPDCALQNATRTVIRAPDQTAATITADDLGGSATVSNVTILSKNPENAAPGESLYGVVARGATTDVVLDNVVVTVAAAGAGTPGQEGTAGADAGVGCAAGDGLAGQPGDDGSGSDGGTFLHDGYQPGHGDDAKPGTPGRSGPLGPVGVCGSCVHDSLDCLGQGVGSCLTPGNRVTLCGDAGAPGCGGIQGTAGGFGTGGGSSIAVFAWDARVTVKNSILTSQNGGAGGNGAPGGKGGAPSVGATGASPGCATSCGPQGGSCVPKPIVTLDGGAGTSGGLGGSGGKGGGGAGGWSCAYFQGGTAQVTLESTSTKVGAPGPAGSPGGSIGVAKERCP